MIFKRKWVHAWARKIDKIVTWVIVWTAVASMVWLSKTKKWKKITQKLWEKGTWLFKKSYSYFGKCLVWTINFLKKK